MLPLLLLSLHFNVQRASYLNAGDRRGTINPSCPRRSSSAGLSGGIAAGRGRGSWRGRTESEILVAEDLMPVPLFGDPVQTSGRGSMAKTVTLRLEQDAYDELRAAAAAAGNVHCDRCSRTDQGGADRR